MIKALTFLLVLVISASLVTMQEQQTKCKANFTLDRCGPRCPPICGIRFKCAAPYTICHDHPICWCKKEDYALNRDTGECVLREECEKEIS